MNKEILELIIELGKQHEIDSCDGYTEMDAGIARLFDWAKSELAKLLPEKSKLEQAGEYYSAIMAWPDIERIRKGNLERYKELMGCAVSELQEQLSEKDKEIEKLKADYKVSCGSVDWLVVDNDKLKADLARAESKSLDYLMAEIKSIIEGGKY
jgi:hypothetical protein